MLQELKKVKSVEWLLILIALVALGLSIAAIAKPCKSNFADTCGGPDCKEPYKGNSCSSYRDCGPDCKCNTDPPGPSDKCRDHKDMYGKLCKTIACPICKDPCTVMYPDQFPYGICGDPKERADEGHSCYVNDDKLGDICNSDAFICKDHLYCVPSVGNEDCYCDKNPPE